MNKDERITGGNKRKIQARAAPRQAFTEAKRQIFLDHLASCANVTRAAAAAGVGVSTVYDARRRDPVFAEQWADAMEAGYATLEALLLERAALGARYGPGETVVPGPETIDTWLALDLLRLSKQAKAPRKAPGAPARRASEKELNEAICAKLDVLERRTKMGKRPSTARGTNGTRKGRKDPHPDRRDGRSVHGTNQEAAPIPQAGEGILPSER